MVNKPLAKLRVPAKTLERIAPPSKGPAELRCGLAVPKLSDGRIGTVVDYLFDDPSWKVRWLVIDCGTWLTGRKVLIHPSAISRENLERRQFVVVPTKAQVEDSPELAKDQPISQQKENQLYTYYGGDPLWGLARWLRP